MSGYCSNLQDLVEEWGKAFSKHHGTTWKWVDLHASCPKMKDDQKHKINARVENVRYKGDEKVIDLPGIVDMDSTTNDASTVHKSTFKRSKSTTSSFTWTMKEGIDIGIFLEFNVGVAPVASATTTITADVSVETTQSKSKTKTETWEVDRDVDVPAHTKMDIIWTIHQKQYSAKFYADVILNGYVAIWNDDKIDINHPGGKDEKIDINPLEERMFTFSILFHFQRCSCK